MSISGAAGDTFNFSYRVKGIVLHKASICRLKICSITEATWWKTNFEMPHRSNIRLGTDEVELHCASSLHR
jgi:hypothetical protein